MLQKLSWITLKAEQSSKEPSGCADGDDVDSGSYHVVPIVVCWRNVTSEAQLGPDCSRADIFPPAETHRWDTWTVAAGTHAVVFSLCGAENKQYGRMREQISPSQRDEMNGTERDQHCRQICNGELEGKVGLWFWKDLKWG